MMRRILLAVFILACALTGVAANWIPPYFLPGTADLAGVRQTVWPRLAAELSEAGFQQGAPVLIRIFKESSELEVWLRDGEAYRKFRTYPICTYSGELGPKLKEGDGQAPEGFYSVSAGQMNPNSRYHLSFNLGFPNAFDRSHKRTGSFLMVHGKCMSVGCYAMTDPAIEEIYLLVEAAHASGQAKVPVHAFPFRLTEDALAERKDHPWADFWANLAEGEQMFAQTGLPPSVGTQAKRYVFSPGT
ncbi:L,D-transpeptidase family protein [Roseibium suaedae]|uniref:Murein L,D-transpeptidase YafK n=1 Tax=Roseibium suaedae TaxID=735517 RepID=A0A1M7G564_9HYPH|nr:murein L,D-transpeptidase family protein [Roseibium suaedae]SHM11512.1 Murein L,D-transpeptidase YafK [Roseibium suaedae]